MLNPVTELWPQMLGEMVWWRNTGGVLWGTNDEGHDREAGMYHVAQRPLTRLRLNQQAQKNSSARQTKDTQQRPESPTVTPSGVQVNTRYINSTEGTSSKTDAPSGIYTLYLLLLCTVRFCFNNFNVTEANSSAHFYVTGE